ncbi:MAG: VF530 family protein [Mariprofundaceae bacterium]
MTTQVNNPLHGMTLEKIINALVEYYGWDELGILININCFNSNPSVKSSLKFLRKTPWARTKVENLYIAMLDEKTRDSKTGWPYSTKPSE